MELIFTENDRRDWVRALRSGEYPQGEAALVMPNNTGKPTYCCLGVKGVACHNGTVEGHSIRINGEFHKGILGDNLLRNQGFFTTLNDICGFSFPEIAKIVELLPLEFFNRHLNELTQEDYRILPGHIIDWANALARGEYLQCCTWLMQCNQHGEPEFCCMGVKMVLDGHTPGDVSGIYLNGEERYDFMPPDGYMANMEFFADLNDVAGFTFAQIAKVLGALPIEFFNVPLSKTEGEIQYNSQTND